MMLSPQAARMGSVHTTLRKVGVLQYRSFLVGGTAAGRSRVVVAGGGRIGGGLKKSPLSNPPPHPPPLSASSLLPRRDVSSTGSSVARAFSTTTTTIPTRNKSSVATAYDELEEDEMIAIDEGSVFNRFQGHAEAAANKTNSDAALLRRSHQEAWMINMGRDDEFHRWLVGDRPAEWFTGLHPNDCPGTNAAGTIRSLPLPNLSSVTRYAAKEYFDNSWTLYETLFAGLKGEEGFYRPPPHGLRHPQIFYYGHTACLYVNKLRVSGVLSDPVNAYFESIFEVGVDEMLWDDMNKNDMLWPTVREVHEYRKQVYETVVNAIATHPSLDGGGNGDGDAVGGVPVDQSHPMWALFMGFEHERIHLETSSVLFRETAPHLVQTPQNWPPLHPSAATEATTKSKTSSSSTNTRPREGVDYPTNRMIPVQTTTAVGDSAEMVVDLGKPADFPSFGWDNEYGERNVNVPPFEASEYMITNGEYWHFVAGGGYRDRKHWTDDGWAWRTHRNIKWPFFWEPDGPAGSHRYTLRTIFRILPTMPWDWPVDVNYYEARAYCSWKSEQERQKKEKKEGGGDDDGTTTKTSREYRVLTEAEHHIIRHRAHNLKAARRDVSADKVMETTGHDFPEGGTGANLNLAFSSQNPVTYFAPSETGHYDTVGSAWEWTEDHFNPLRGFEVHHVYDDFSTPCFDGKHSMIVGGSFVSTGDEASVFARFHFRPHFLQHSGFRLVASEHEAPATHLYAGNFDGQAAARDEALTMAAEQQQQQHQLDTNSNIKDNNNTYETDASLHMYLGLHYPSSGEKEGVPAILPHDHAPAHGLRFPQRVVNLLTALGPEKTNNRALDIGCAVGGASFELAKTFDRVDAFDYSASFVNAAKRMQERGVVRFEVPVEADLVEEVDAVHESGVTPQILSKVSFFRGDACRMAEMASEGQLGTYDGIVMSNLLCRLPDPVACLDGLPPLVNKGGVVVMVTPYSWLTEFTPRGKWLGGFADPVSKEPIRSKDALRKIMESNGFEKIHEEQMPLIIREHARKYQYIVSEATGWRRK